MGILLPLGAPIGDISVEVGVSFIGLQFLGLLFTHTWPPEKQVSDEPCRKTAFFSTGLQFSPLFSQRLQTGFRLSPTN
jgi:hypothetical protein